MSILEHTRSDTEGPGDETETAASVWLPNRRNADVRTYRGKSLEALLPKIRSELGDNAVVLREREGLMGGVGGFFSTRFIEVQARAGGPGIDVYDEDDDLELPTVPSRPASSVMSALSSGSAFSDRLDEAVLAWSTDPGVGDLTADETELPAAETGPVDTREEAPVQPTVLELDGPEELPRESRRDTVFRSPAEPPAAGKPAGRGRGKLPRTPPQPRPIDTEAAARALADLVESGASEAFARGLIRAAAGHGAAVAGGLRAAVRQELARRLTATPALPAHGGAIAFVGTGGSGKTLASAALAATYRYGSALPVSVASLCETYPSRSLAETLAADEVPVTRVPERAARGTVTVLRQIASERRDGLVIIDTPAVSPSDPAAVSELSARLDQISPDTVYLVLPATLGLGSAKRALSGLSPLGLSGIVISHADETDQIGVLVELAATQSLPVVYITAGADHRRSLIGTDPSALAQLMLP